MWYKNLDRSETRLTDGQNSHR